MKLSRGLVLFGAVFLTGAATLSAQAGGVTCKDGSKSAGGRGACSGHGGIMAASAKAKVAEKRAEKAEVKAEKADAKAAKAERKAESRTSKVEMVTCVDGARSEGGRGACSGHGGILTAAAKAKMEADAKAAKAQAKADAKAAKADAKAARREAADDRDARGATAECRDHYYSHAANHQGACSRHGGVARFLDGK